MRPKNAAVVHFLGKDDAVLRLEIFRQGVTNPHMERAVHLPLELDRIEDPADVMGSDHFYELAIVIKNRKLRRESVADMRFGTARLIKVISQFGGIRATPLADESSADKIRQRFTGREFG